MNLHHDGSELYISNSAPKPGEKVEFRIAAHSDDHIASSYLRIFHDGEPRIFEMKKIKSPRLSQTEKKEEWWGVKVEVLNPNTKYHFIIEVEEELDKKQLNKNEKTKKVFWFDAFGIHEYNPGSAHDFQLLVMPAYPKWLEGSVFYQIFPDRFAKSDRKYQTPKWAIPRAWNLKPTDKDPATPLEYYGGDIWGVVDKFQYVKKLGITGIYFTPFFPSTSNHRYDATSFDKVDPLLGGNAALKKLIEIAHKSKIKVLGDLTTNHTGSGHEWFIRAKKSKSAKERSYYYFDSKLENGYVGWWGVASLPKLNFNSKALKAALYEKESSVVKRWLKFGLDGWRIDVGNMTGRYYAEDFHDEVMVGVRKAITETNPNAWLVAENADLIGKDLDGSGWHGTMNYEGFMRPFWSWIRDEKKISTSFTNNPIPPTKLSSQALVKSITAFNANVPWRSLLASMTLLDSHDTARFTTFVGKDFGKQIAGMTFLMTYPGVPSIFAGDEIGLEGETGEDGRRTIPWENPELWDQNYLEIVRELISIRKKYESLFKGSLRFVLVEENHFGFLRETSKESFFILIARKSGNTYSHSIPLKALNSNFKISEKIFEKFDGPNLAGAAIFRGELRSGL